MDTNVRFEKSKVKMATSEMEQGYSASNEYATYTLKETCSPEDSVMNLGIVGVAEELDEIPVELTITE